MNQRVVERKAVLYIRLYEKKYTKYINNDNAKATTQPPIIVLWLFYRPITSPIALTTRWFFLHNINNGEGGCMCVVGTGLGEL